MAITFPRALPPFGMQDCDFDLERYGTTNFTEGGETDFQEFADPRWRLSCRTVPLNAIDLRRCRAWIESLQGAAKFFLGRDPGYTGPAAYPDGLSGLTRAGGGAFDGTGAIADLDAGTIDLTQLPAGFELTEGDYVGLLESGARGLYRILEDVSADGGGAATVTVEPPVITDIFTSAATYDVLSPACIMLLTEHSAPQGSETSDVSFSGLQVIA